MRTLVLERARVPGYGFEVESQHVLGGMLEATKYGWDNGDKSGSVAIRGADPPASHHPTATR